MRKLKQQLSSVLVFVFLFAIIQFPNIAKAAEPSTEVKVETYAALVGNLIEANNLGKNWEPINKQTVMKNYGNGKFLFTMQVVKPGSYNYKVAFNGQWDAPKAIGNKGENKVINITEEKSVTFFADLKAGTVIDSINDKASFKDAASLVGTLAQAGGKDWTPADTKFELTAIGDGFYKGTFDLKKGDYKYKVAYNHDWGNGEVQSDISLKLDSDAKITFLANPLLGICVDSKNVTKLDTSVSLIGTARGDEAKNWDVANKEFDFCQIDGNGTCVYSALFNKGDYAYKVLENYAWNNESLSAGDNIALSIPSDNTMVVFVANPTAKTKYDSINNPKEVATALGLAVAPVKVDGGVKVNEDGTVTFTYINPKAQTVYLAGSITDSKPGKAMTLSDKEQGVWSFTTRVGDKAQQIEYKFIVDGNEIQDPSNPEVKDGNSLVKFAEYKGRPVTLPGSIQTAIGKAAWDPANKDFQFEYLGNGLYEYVLKNANAGSYEYKIALNYKWDPENYGLNGADHGANITLTIPSNQDVKFIYNDDSHRVVDSVNYKSLDITLHGKGIADTKLTDAQLTGIYSILVKIPAGAYDDLSLTVKEGNNSKEVSVAKVAVDKDKNIKFSYDPATEFAFNDASDNKLDINGVYYNSKDTEYKTSFGAIPTDKDVTFNLKIKKDMATHVKMILNGPKGTEKLEMDKTGSFGDGQDKWSKTLNVKELGMYSYYFVVTNGSDVKAYGDDDGFFGVGVCGDLGTIKNYEFNVYDKNFKTPNWLKNGIIYQIFPDRFFDGDTSNDYSQKYARGNSEYEFYNDWYKVTEDPALEFITNKDGSITPNPDYKGTKGDGAWSNEMYGGDLVGVQKKLDYLQSIGVTVLYFNPVGQSISSHRYDTTDYSKVDPLLGHMEDFVNLSKEAKSRGMHIILDGVYNHVSDDSIYFDRYNKYVATGKPLGAYQYWSYVYKTMNTEKIDKAVAEAKAVEYFKSQGITDLHYKDWFIVENKLVDEGKSTEHYQYEGWWGYDSMPVIQALNGSEYQVKSWADEVIDGPDAISRQWLREGNNGWRLDVANEVSDETWQHFRKAVKSEGDNAIVGEIWTDASKYILGDMYDSVMNYRFRGAIGNFVNGKSLDGQDGNYTATDAIKELEKMEEQYPKEALEAMMNLVDSHDTQRILSALDGAKKSEKGFAKDPSQLALAKMKLIPFLQMTLAGAPTIYYGDEAGIVGSDDPDNRRGMIWGQGNKELVEWYANLGTIRNNYEVLRTGDTNFVSVDKNLQDDVMAFERLSKDNYALVVVNRKTDKLSSVSIDVTGVENGTVLTNALNKDNKYIVKDKKVTVDVEALNGLILVKNYKDVKVNYSALKDAYDPSFKVANQLLPKSDKELIENIANSTDKKVQIELKGNESVSMKVIKEAKKADVTLSVKTEDGTTFTFADKAVYDKLTALGIFDLKISNQPNLKNQDKLDSLIKSTNAKILAKLNLSIEGLEHVDFGGTVTVKALVNKDLAGKKVCVYNLDDTGKAIKISEVTVDGNGYITFDVTHFSDYFVASDELKVSSTNPANPGDTTTNPGNTTIKSGDATKSGDTTKSVEQTTPKEMPKTGGIPGSEYAILGGLMILSGLVLVRRRKEIA